MTWLSCGVMGLAAAAATPLALAAESARDYAWGMELALDGDTAYYEFAVPREVYESAQHADLRDLRMFDAAGEAVPFAFRPRPRNAAAPEPAPVDLAFEAIRTAAPEGVDAVEMRVSHESGRPVIEMRTPDADAGASARLVGYLADATMLTEPVHAARIGIPADVMDVITRVTLEASDDLRTWTPLASDAPLLQLNAGIHRLERRRIEFAPQRMQYLRLSWPGRARALELTSFAVEPGAPPRETSRQWKEVQAVAATDTRNRYDIDLGGRFPADRLSFALPQANTVATMGIYSRASLLDSWELVRNATVYRLSDEGGDLYSDDVVLDGSGRRYWRIAFDPRGGGIGRGDPGVRAGWVPHRVVFAARGARPFVLAYGSRDATPAASEMAAIAPGWSDETPASRVAVGRARVQDAHPLAGESVLVEGLDWRRVALWSSLVLSLGVLAAMALQLARQMTS